MIFTGIIVLLVKPWAIMRYLRTVHGAQRSYHDLYTPLTTLTDIRTTTTLAQAQPDALDEPAQHNEYISLLQLVEHQQAPLLVLGVPGAGKTMALRAYQYLTSEQAFKLAMTGGKVPIYVPMKNYSLYLKQQQADTLLSDDENHKQTLSPSLISYLAESDLPGMRYLHAHIIALFKQGRLLLLCDGLNEVDSDYLAQVSTELAAICARATIGWLSPVARWIIGNRTILLSWLRMVAQHGLSFIRYNSIRSMRLWSAMSSSNLVNGSIRLDRL